MKKSREEFEYSVRNTTREGVEEMRRGEKHLTERVMSESGIKEGRNKYLHIFKNTKLPGLY